MNTVRVQTLDLFCGGGGSSWGARSAGAEIVCGVDSWDLAIAAYSRNFPEARAVQLQMTERSGPEAIAPVGRIDLLLASPECTNHTCARGNKPRSEDSRLTARYVVNFAEGLKPRWIIIENVVHMRSWSGYTRLIDDLQGLGYRTKPIILDAARFGVPQSRRRVFILCDRERDPPASIPMRPGRARTAASVLDPPGTWPSAPLRKVGRAAPTLERAGRAIRELGPGQPFMIVYYGSDGSGGWQPLDRPLRTLTTLDRFGLVTWEREVPMLRMLQVPELTRAMGFDSTYNLDGVGTRRDRIKILGNGVAPPVMAAVVRALVFPADSHRQITVAQEALIAAQ